MTLSRPLSLPVHAPDGAEDITARFDAVVRAHYGRLCAFVWRQIGDRSAAEDVVQDIFARIWERADRFDYRDPLPYLYRAARNGVLMHRRHERVSERWRAHTARLAGDAATDLPHQIETDELTNAIARAVDELPQRCRLIFTMHREQDLRYADIARLLGISVKTVETQMARALRALRRSLAPYLPAGVGALVMSLSDRLLS